ncbi:MAG: protease modulator HflK, partial [Lentisphaeria bacterium]|nr:protease modulator HflK [Lentisphaeria bacterium]
MENNGGTHALIKMLKLIFGGLRVLIVLLLVAFCFSGYFLVRENEQALVLRFGKIVGKPGMQLIDSGQWHWAWPSPIDRVVRIPVKKNLRIASKSFWYANLEETDETILDNKLSPGRDGYLLTGDANIIHMNTVAICQISDPVAYFLSHKSVDNNVFLRTIVDQSVLEVVANWKMDEALYRKVEQLQQRLIVKVNRKFKELNLGLEVKAFNIEKSTPPRAVVEAFDEVLRSEMNKNTVIDQAFAYGSRKVNRAEGDGAKVVAQAKLSKSKLLSSLKADVFYFEALLKQYKQFPESTVLTIYN